MYNSEKKTLQNLYTAANNDVMFEGFNKNLITFKDMNLDNQHFEYNPEKKSWNNIKTGNAIDLMLDKFNIDQNVITEPPDATDGQKWDNIYCDA